MRPLFVPFSACLISFRTLWQPTIPQPNSPFFLSTLSHVTVLHSLSLSLSFPVDANHQQRTISGVQMLFKWIYAMPFITLLLSTQLGIWDWVLRCTLHHLWHLHHLLQISLCHLGMRISPKQYWLRCPLHPHPAHISMTLTPWIFPLSLHRLYLCPHSTQMIHSMVQGTTSLNPLRWFLWTFTIPGVMQSPFCVVTNFCHALYVGCMSPSI